MEKKYKQLTWSIVLSFLFLFSVGLLVLPKSDYSAQENRYLEQFPTLSLQTLSDGSFMEDFETYVCDHFPLRNAFMTVRTWYERLTGHNQVNGIYFCNDDYFIEEYETPEHTDRIISAFSRLEEKVTNASITFLLAPTAVTIYADKLPKNARNADQLAELETIYASLSSTKVDITNAFLAQKDTYPLYYRLDHHWTSYGAYFAYVEYCHAVGLTPYAMDEFNITVVSDDFQGTIYSKLNDSFAGTDEITVFSKEPTALTVTYFDTGEVTDTLYAPEYLDTKDQYSYFLNNIHPMIQITNQTADNDHVLVLIKDSYANCIVPFLANHYASIYVVDTRYYKNSVSTFINEHTEVTDVLVLYNLNTIDDDLGIGGIY